MEVIAADDGAPLLRRFSRIHVDGAQIGEGFAYIVNIVVIYQMVIAKDQYSRMRRIMKLIVGHPVPCP
ncbi:hypothetical protein D3C75_1216910 [compost metagenome]